MPVSLRWLLALTVISALWLYAALFPYNKFVCAAYTAVIVAIAIGIVLSLLSPRRVFWIAFSAATFSYAFLTLLPFTFSTLRPYMFTDVPLRVYANAFKDEIIQRSDAYDQKFLNDRVKGLTTPRTEVYESAYFGELKPEEAEFRLGTPPTMSWNCSNILFIGHAYFALVFGFGVGLFAAWTQRRIARAAEASAKKSALPAAQ